MTTTEEYAQQVHILIHSLRLIPKYKPSEAEVKLSRMTIEHFKDTCRECMNVSESIKNAPPVKKGFFAGIMDAVKGE